MRSSRTRTRRRCAMPTRPAGASRRFAGKTGRAARGCGPRSAATRSLSISTLRAAPRRRSSCSAKPSLDTVIVCDRYSAYKRLARLREGLVTLAFCWSHQRRDFIECAAGQVSLTQWCQGWVEQIAVLYRLNEARLEHYDPGLERQTPAFDAAQGRLKEALDGLFAEAEQELAGLPDQSARGQGAALAGESSRGAVRLRRPAPGAAG